MEGKGRGVGLMGAWQGTSDWYGGRIQQVGRLYKEENKITIKLEAMEMQRSHRFARYCGSRRILQIRIPDDIGDSADVRKFLCQKFVLCGRVFIAFHSKEGSVYMVETNENYQRQTRNDFGDQRRQSLFDFINWHNPIELNKKQVSPTILKRLLILTLATGAQQIFQPICLRFVKLYPGDRV